MHQSLSFIAHRSNTAQHVSGIFCPSSGAYKLQLPPLVYRWNVVVAVYIYIYIYDISSLMVNDLTLILLTWRKW